MQPEISITVLQIGTGMPLPTAKVMGIPTEGMRVQATQNQSGGGVPFDNYIQNPATAAAVYSRITVPNGGFKEPTLYFSSELVAAVIAKSQA